VLRAAVQALASGYGPSPAIGLLPAGGWAVRKLFLAGRSLFRRGAGRAGGAKVWVLLVHPEHRRQGVATALLRAAERYLRGRGAREVTVTVTEDNRPAQTLYEKAGFREAGRCLESSGPSLVLVKQLTEVRADRFSRRSPACAEAAMAKSAQPIRLALVITRMVLGGAPQVVWSLFERLPPTEYQVVLVSGPEGLHLPETEQLPGQVVVARHLRRDLSPVHDALAVVELAGAFRRFGVNLVHTHTSKAGVLGRLAARLAGVRAVVHTPHGHIYAPEAHIQSVPRCATLRAGFLWSERLAGRWTTLLTTLTAAEARETVALGLAPADRVVPVPNGIEAEDFARE
ncbi:MAG: GNAT family N-acetyltransferase, partial [Planctomycetes bacterium]|nr:GNAT family N-acetyltransferase [Planctomycetota bacterium]